ncbi:MAG: Spy/CpxP family protein refolding chaperone [Alphaproteobacteria bacterium]|nr:Spy/CpxP family protein refolding chaperone [Alphaproteobacteria bacterium]
MKMIKVMLVVFCLCCGYAMPAFSASDNPAAAMEVKKGFPHKMRHHRGLSLSMMKELNLNDAQKAQWKELVDQKNSETKVLREQRQKLHEQERDINEKYEAKVKKILDQEQLAKYESLLLKRPKHGHKHFGKRKEPKE